MVTRRSELTCRELARRVDDYLEEVLSPLEKRRFDAHVAACSDCAAYLVQVRQTLDALARSRRPVPPLASATRASLVAAFRAHRER